MNWGLDGWWVGVNEWDVGRVCVGVSGEVWVVETSHCSVLCKRHAGLEAGGRVSFGGSGVCASGADLEYVGYPQGKETSREMRGCMYDDWPAPTQIGWDWTILTRVVNVRSASYLTYQANNPESGPVYGFRWGCFGSCWVIDRTSSCL